jgi:hypothetical protein
MRVDLISWHLEPALVDDPTAAKMLGVGVSYFRVLVSRGAIGPEPIWLGKRRLHRVDLLRRWVRMGMPDRAAWQARQQQ